MAWDEGMTHRLCGVAGCQQCHCHWCVQTLAQERDAARFDYQDVCQRIAYWVETVSRLRAALARHGVHDEDCFLPPGDGERLCDCGLDKARQEAGLPLLDCLPSR